MRAKIPSGTPEIRFFLGNTSTSGSLASEMTAEKFWGGTNNIGTGENVWRRYSIVGRVFG